MFCHSDWQVKIKALHKFNAEELDACPCPPDDNIEQKCIIVPGEVENYMQK